MFLGLMDQSSSMTVLSIFDILCFCVVSPILALMQALITLRPTVNAFMLLKKQEVAQINRFKK